MSKDNAEHLARNKKALHYYELLETLEAGLALTGPEVKSLRAGKGSFHDAYVVFRQGEAFLQGLRVAPYSNSGYARQEPDRERKLLLHAAQIHALAAKVEQKGLTLVPLDLHLRNGRVKVCLALGRGRKLHDQRRALKDAAEERDTQRELA